MWMCVLCACLFRVYMFVCRIFFVGHGQFGNNGTTYISK